MIYIMLYCCNQKTFIFIFIFIFNNGSAAKFKNRCLTVAVASLLSTLFSDSGSAVTIFDSAEQHCASLLFTLAYPFETYGFETWTTLRQFNWEFENQLWQKCETYTGTKRVLASKLTKLNTLPLGKIYYILNLVRVF